MRALPFRASPPAEKRVAPFYNEMRAVTRWIIEGDCLPEISKSPRTGRELLKVD